MNDYNVGANTVGDPMVLAGLEYVAELNDQAYYPTSSEVDTFVTSPNIKRRPALLGTVFQVVEMFGRTELAETPTAYMSKVSWIYELDARWQVTDLGRALIRANLSRSRQQPDATTQVHLDSEDPMVIARAIHAVASMGPGMIVDPYLGFDQICLLLSNTSATRLLTTKQMLRDEGVKATELALNAVENREIEIRIASSGLHDRYLISDAGPISTMGASLNRVGVTSTVVAEIHADPADKIRKSLEKIWRCAARIEPYDGPQHQSLTGQVRSAG